MTTLKHRAMRRREGFFDQVIGEASVALQVLSGAAVASRPNPAGRRSPDESEVLNQAQQRHAAGLMRINHVGEICAQALYRGQAMAVEREQTKELLREAAKEEVDHLVWCQDRLKELNSRVSLLNPIWYAGSFALGLAASRAGERYNLGFMAETERQVEAHLNGHLKSLPQEDERSRKIVAQMRDDEIEHRRTAQKHGGVDLPFPIPSIMKFMSKVMTKSVYYI
ncbi:MAG: 2-polyprenyl-3-methyl-6-methoxy-1,4-benzoquinone monooxygenase [Burkholderiaceae bacterium]|nr:2-polyprenyl-3-methyl-6-methoxy-1,4-benzoquinone monooxygenase [Burkholderiaceae bacterium]MCD8537649.1 2-polyprenyl-3-methyl-6-methoxy-1,4-benzoquinone monooxygenase [Burkholderiaceae bacterium]